MPNSFYALLRNGLNRQRTARRRRHSEIVPAAALEARVLLAATNILSLNDIALSSDTDSRTVVLGDHFDDPEITGSTVSIETPLGSFIIETFDQVTAITAQNFVDLTTANNYTDMFFHRSVPGFIVQGGGFVYAEGDNQPSDVNNNGTIVNEFDNWFDENLGGRETGTPINTRGTVAMAKLGGDPHSATSQWFVNLIDNSEVLDPQNGGFTVFGHVLFDGMDTVDAIAALPLVNAGAPFDTLPVRDFTSGNIQREHLVTSTSTVVDELSFEIVANSNAQTIAAVIVDGELQVAAIQGQSGAAVITVQATDLNGATVSASFEVAVGVPLSTSLTGPDQVGNSYRPVFSWQTSENATGYELWVNQVGGTTAIIHETTLTGTSFTATSDLTDGDYIAWIRSKGSSGPGLWSEAKEFSVGLTAVTITSPSTTSVDIRRPTIEWTASANATEYDLWINHVGVQNQLIRETSLTTTSFTPAADLADGTYRIWVKAKNASSETDWSPAVTVKVDAANVQVTGPTGESIPPSPEITWTGDASATYELWVNQIGGTSAIIHEVAVAGTSFTPASDLADGPYRAWARLRPAGGQPGKWSLAFDFVVGADSTPGTVQITAVTGTDTPRPTFSWAAADHAARYELWVNEVGGTSRVIGETTLTELQFTALNDLIPGKHRAWLRAVNSSNVAGDWSNAFDFTIA